MIIKKKNLSTQTKTKELSPKPKSFYKAVCRPETWKRNPAAAKRKIGKKYLSQPRYGVPDKNSGKFSIELENAIFSKFHKLDVNAKTTLLLRVL